jgi:hypothetical protein
MAFKRSNKMNLREQKVMDSLLELISTSNNEELQHEANMYKLRSTFGRDSMESEQQTQFEGSSSEESEKVYARRKDEMRNASLNRSTAQPNLRDLNSTPLSDVNASRAKDFSSFSKHPDQPSIRSSSVFDSFAYGARQGRAR